MRRAASRLALFLTAILLWCGLAGGAFAERRVALVIGNSSYQKVTPLPNPSNDAHDVAALLQGLGFHVINVIDADQNGFNRALGEFSRRAIDADAALFFYAGHGIQVRGQNYLLPVDADAKDEISAEFEFVALERVRQALDRAAPTAVRIMILDACRDNPLARSAQATRAVGSATRGLARIDLEAVGGMVVVYATQPNQVAQDGTERNSPFTSALLARLKEPGLEVGALFRRVTNDVRQKTQGKQIPELSISLGQDYYLNRNETDATAFDRIAESGNPADFRDFIARFPGSSRTPLARRMIDMLEANIAQRRQDVDERQRAEAARREQEATRAREAAAQLAATERQRAEAATLAAQAAERERLAREQREAAAALARLEVERIERQRAEAGTLAAQAAERERLAREQREAAAAQARLEVERIEAQRAEAARLAALAAEREQSAASSAAATAAAPEAPEAQAPAAAAVAQAQPAAPARADDEAERKRREEDRRTAELIAAQARAQESMRLAQTQAGGRSAVALATLGAAAPQAGVAADTPELLRGAQIELKRLRCYAGPIDGKVSPAIRTALAAYGKQIGGAFNTETVTDALVAEMRSRAQPVCGGRKR